jgi:uroporphyrinogen-III synthase
LRVLITRPEPDAAKLAKALRAKGHESVPAPLLAIELTAEPPPEGTAQARLAFTSANGVRAAKARGLRPTKGVLAIGPATAEAAREAGFPVAAVARSDLASLVRAALDNLSTDETIVHVTGADRAGDLKGALEQAGFHALRWIAYRAQAAEALPQAAQRFFTGEPGAVALFSPRSARILVRLIGEAGLAGEARRHVVLCLSSAVAAAAGGAEWRQIRVAPQPAQEALIALMEVGL